MSEDKKSEALVTTKKAEEHIEQHMLPDYYRSSKDSDELVLKHLTACILAETDPDKLKSLLALYKQSKTIKYQQRKDFLSSYVSFLLVVVFLIGGFYCVVIGNNEAAFVLWGLIPTTLGLMRRTKDKK